MNEQHPADRTRLQARPTQVRPVQAGFTLVEIMVVIVILGLLATMVAQNVIGASDTARIGTTQASLKSIHEAVSLYYLNNGKLPSSLEDLTNNDAKGGAALTELGKDAWDHDFILRGETRNDFEIISCGPDGSENTEDDLSSRKKKE
ncbi:MAG: type II secretion system protein GspG [Planctomycetes bacterium]|jgi:general secretion pathway protein G|nr:type II secretion system protein GspG [Planctomycetota bacterium]